MSISGNAVFDLTLRQIPQEFKNEINCNLFDVYYYFVLLVLYAVGVFVSQAVNGAEGGGSRRPSSARRQSQLDPEESKARIAQQLRDADKILACEEQAGPGRPADGQTT